MRPFIDRNVVMGRMIVYEYETWFVTLSERHRMRVFENRALRGISGCKRKEVKGGWRKLCSEGHMMWSARRVLFGR